MKNTKAILSLLVLFFFAAQTNIYAGKPIPSVGIVVKKNPGSGIERIVKTGSDGSFSLQLEEGEYTLIAPAEQLKVAASEIIKSNDTSGKMQSDAEGFDITLEDNLIQVKDQPQNGRTYNLDKKTSSLIVIVPKGGAKLSGKLSWDGSIKGGKTERKGWDGSIKGSPKGISENGLK